MRTHGGYRKGSGRGKSGWYKGIYCDSSWELAFIIYHIDKNIPIIRCKEKRTYLFENKTYNYFPDFVVDNLVYEIKGFKTPKSIAKELQHPDIKVIDKNSIIPYLKYATEKYGSHFIELYEGRSQITRPPAKKRIVKKKIHYLYPKKPRSLYKTTKGKKLSEETKRKVSENNGNKLETDELALRLKVYNSFDFSKRGSLGKFAEAIGVSHTQARRFINKWRGNQIGD